jgi:cold shock CspA family protein
MKELNTFDSKPERIQANLKFLDKNKGFGFFKRPNKQDVFFTIKQLANAKIDPNTVKENDLFEFDLIPIPGKGGKAVNLKKIDK